MSEDKHPTFDNIIDKKNHSAALFIKILMTSLALLAKPGSIFVGSICDHELSFYHSWPESSKSQVFLRIFHDIQVLLLLEIVKILVNLAMQRVKMLSESGACSVIFWVPNFATWHCLSFDIDKLIFLSTCRKCGRYFRQSTLSTIDYSTM